MAFVSTLSHVHIRPIGALFLMILAFWLYRVYCLHSPTAQQPPFQLPAKLMARLNERYEHVLALRRENPRKFAVRMSLVLLGLAVIGHLFAGSFVVLFAMAGSAMLFIRQRWFAYGREVDRVDGAAISKGKAKLPIAAAVNTTQPPEDMDDEFMPESSDANEILLRRAAGDEASMSTLNESTTCDADSDTSDTDNTFDLMPKDAVPDINEHSDTSSGDECDMVIDREVTQKKATRASNTTSGLRFRKDHFKNGSSPDYSSSSSDEDAIMKGLDFNSTLYATFTDPSTSALDAIQNAAGKAMTKVVTAMVHQQMQYNDNEVPGGALYLSDSSNDSEFEIINHE